MGAETAEFIVGLVAGYLVAGLVFAAVFVVRGVAVIDPGAHDMPWSARLLILPGVVALWPLMLWKWISRQAQPDT
jgi:hypothetical protein